MTMLALTAQDVVQRARRGAEFLTMATTTEKNGVLVRLADVLTNRIPSLLEANAWDVAAAQAAGRGNSFIDRLRLTPDRILSAVNSVLGVARLEDPVGRIDEVSRRPNGMLVGKMRVPIGVILMIYEARPNVTIDAAALCLKAGNAIILRSGSEAGKTNQSLAALFDEAEIPAGTVQVLDDPGRGLMMDLLASDGIDLAIPRGSEALIRTVTEVARIPLLKHFKGVCHIFVDRDADFDTATTIVLNAKTQRPSTCNALETLLVDRAIAARWLPGVVLALRRSGVKVRGCPETVRLSAEVEAATENEWGTEYLDLILAVRIVADFDEAIDHIRRYSTGLADGVITQHQGRAMRFLQAVDSAAVLVNASTRLVDGYEFGLGAEIGISTSRLGPRGPIGLRELTAEKWIVLGDGQLRLT